MAHSPNVISWNGMIRAPKPMLKDLCHYPFHPLK